MTEVGMKIAVLTLRFDSERGGFDDSALVRLTEVADIIDVQQHFFEHERMPWLLLVVRYRPADEAPRRERPSTPGERPRTTAASEEAERLDPHERRIYEALRVWRNGRAELDGVPAYVVQTNRALMKVARAAPAGREQLAAIGGFGDRKMQAYGDEILRVVVESVASDSAPAAAAATTPTAVATE